MSDQFFTPSNKLKAAQFAASPLWATIKERFETCPNDKAFALRHTECEFTETQLRSLISRKGRQVGRLFRVIKHNDEAGEIVYEIGPTNNQRSMMRNDDVFDHSKETQYQQMDSEEAVDNEA